MTDAAPAKAPGGMGAGTLGRRLVVRTTALVAVVSVVLSLFIALASFQILRAQLDGRLQSAAARGPGGGPTGEPHGDLEGSGLLRISATWPKYQAPAELSEETQAMLLALPADGAPQTIRIPELGFYRVLAQSGRSGAVTVVGLPFSEVTRPLTQQALMAALLTLGVIVLSALLARRLVAHSLRPLNRLAVTASQVASLPLASGEGNLPVRVPQADLDPRSEVGQVGIAFNQMLDHVEGALDARHRSETKVRQFVVDASHELRNQRGDTSGYAELTRRSQAELPNDTAHALARIESESDRMSALVEDLLLLARLDSQPTLDLQPADVTQILLNAVDDARVAGTAHRWELDLPEEAVLAQADPHRLHQVVANLLANARVHTPAGTTVVTSLRAEGDQVVIRVTDDGPGVPPEIRDTVFERFTRAEASRVRHAGGSSTGLGLAIVAAVIAAHRGTVTLETAPGATTFALRLPAA